MKKEFKPTQYQIRALKQRRVPLAKIRELCKLYTDQSVNFLDFAIESLGEKQVISSEPYTNGQNQDGLMTSDWTLSNEVFESLKSTGIDMQLVMHQVELFKIYWISKKESRPNWETLFIGRLSHLQPIDNKPKRKSVAEMLTDTSWAYD